MKPQSIPVHINAVQGKIAPNVIFTGDPLRAKYIAESFLSSYELVTDVRNMLGYTGLYNNELVTIMSSGMGIPSAGIYTFELLYYYHVKKIIRVGSCGATSNQLNLGDIVLADSVYSETDFAYAYNGFTEKLIKTSKSLNREIMRNAQEQNQEIKEGVIITTPVFGPYADPAKVYEKVPKNLDILAEEMEGFAICHLANEFNCEATVLVSVVDSPFTKEFISVEDRKISLNKMIKIALDSIVK